MTTTAYPLSWPDGWTRTPTGDRVDSRYRFKTKPVVALGSVSSARPVSFDVARKKLLEELARLGAENVVISTNLPLRADGQPRADAARYRTDDPGVAVYFSLKKKQMVMACDRYDACSANMRSVGLAIEAMRQLERHGGGAMMERAFSGFAAIAPPGYPNCWEVLGIAPTKDEGAIADAYVAKAKVCHPDRGGAVEAMT